MNLPTFLTQKFKVIFWIYVSFHVPLRSKKAGRYDSYHMRHSLFLPGVTQLCQVAQSVCRAPPPNTLPASLNLYGTTNVVVMNTLVNINNNII